MKHQQLVIADKENDGVYLELLTSDKPIDLERVIRFYEQSDGLDFMQDDNIQLVDEPTERSID